MGATFKYVAPLAGALGYSIEDTAVAIGLMANSGIKGEQAGTTMRAMLANLSDPSDKVSGAMQALGISMMDATGKAIPFSDLIGDLRHAFSELTEAEQVEMAASLAGREAMSGLLAIVNASDEDFAKLTASVNDCAGATDRMAAEMLDNLAGDVEELSGAFESAALSLSDFLTPALRTVTQAITKGVDWFNSLDDSLKNIIFRVGAIAAAIGPALLVGGKLLTLTSGFIGPLGLVAGAVALVYQHSERVRNIVGTVTGAIGGFFSGIKTGLESYSSVMAAGLDKTTAINTALFNAFGPKNAMAIQRVMRNLQSGFKKVSDTVKPVVDAVGSFFGALIDGKPAMESLETALSKVFSSETTGKIMSVANTIHSGLTSAFTTVQDVAGKAFAALGEGVESAKTYFSDLANDIQAAWSEDGILGVFSVLGDALREALTSAADAAREGAEFVREKIGEGLTLAQEWLLPKAREWMGNLGTALSTAKESVVEKLPAVREAIANGLQVTKETLTAKAQDVMTWLGNAYRSDTVQGFLGNLSGVASTIMDKISDVKEGLTEKAATLVNALGTAMGSPAVKEKVSQITGVVATLAEKITSGVGAWQTTAATLISDLVLQMSETGMTETMLTGLGNVTEAIISGIGSAAANFAGAAGVILTNLLGAFLNDGTLVAGMDTAATILSAIVGAIGNATVSFGEAAEKIVGAIYSQMAGIDWTKVATSASSFATTLIDKIGEQIPKATTALESLGAKIATGVRKVNWAGMTSVFTETAAAIIDGILDNAPTVIEGAGKIIDAIGEGIVSAVDALGQVAGQLIGGIIKFVLTPDNWLRLMELGNSILAGIGEGMIKIGLSALEATGRFVIQSLAGSIQAVMDLLGIEYAVMPEEVKRVYDDVHDVVNEQGERLTAQGTVIMQQMLAPITSTTELYNATQAWGVALSEGISSSMQEVAWLGNEQIVALMGVLVDTTASEADRAKAAVALNFLGFGEQAAAAITTSTPGVMSAAREMGDMTIEQVITAMESLGIVIPTRSRPACSMVCRSWKRPPVTWPTLPASLKSRPASRRTRARSATRPSTPWPTRRKRRPARSPPRRRASATPSPKPWSRSPA